MLLFFLVIVSSAILITAFNWKLGVFESIAVTVAVGLSDFTAHHSLEYSRRKSVLKMTSPTFFSAMTTITIGLSMLLFSSVLVYQQIGAFFTVLIIVSWLYSVCFLSPILDLFDKARDLATSICRLYSVDGYSGTGRQISSSNNFHHGGRIPHVDSDASFGRINGGMDNDNISATVVFSNPNASNESRRNSTEELDEDEDEEKTPAIKGISRVRGGIASPSTSMTKSNPNVHNSMEEPSAIIEKVKLLKKVAAETSV